MRTQQGSVLEALRRTRDFLDANAELLSVVNKSSARRNLDDVAAQLAAHGATQDGSARASVGETARQRRLRVTLRSEHMLPIALVAKRKLQELPEFQALRMPRGHLTAQPLIAVARGMAEAARQHADVLVEHGLQDDFIEQLLAAALSLEKSLEVRDAFRSARTGSTAGLADQEARGRVMLRVLDATVRPRLGDNEVLLAQWNAAKYVKRARSTAGMAPVSVPVFVPSDGEAPVALSLTPAPRAA